MNFSSFLIESLLLEGGAAIKGASRITQVEARHVIPDVVGKVSRVLGVPKERVRAVGSAGRKPYDGDLSGDVDVAVECSSGDVSSKLAELSHDGASFRAMPSINIYSFGELVNGKTVQVDVVPVSDIDFASWSFASDPRDLADGLKGAHRNELMFAVAKHLDQKSREVSGQVVEMERYFFDLSRGLMRGVQTRYNQKGKLGKNFSTVDKYVVSTDPRVVSSTMFGEGYDPDDLTTFGGVWDAIHGSSFPCQNRVQDIVSMARDGIKKKNLVVPTQMK